MPMHVTDIIGRQPEQARYDRTIDGIVSVEWSWPTDGLTVRCTVQPDSYATKGTIMTIHITPGDLQFVGRTIDRRERQITQSLTLAADPTITFDTNTPTKVEGLAQLVRSAPALTGCF